MRNKDYSVSSVNIKGFFWCVETYGIAVSYTKNANLFRVGYRDTCVARLRQSVIDPNEYSFMSCVGNERGRAHYFRAASVKAALASAERFFPLYAAAIDKEDCHV